MKAKSYIAEVNSLGGIYLPRDAQKALSVTSGDCVKISFTDGKLIITNFNADRRKAWVELWLDRALADTSFGFIIHGHLTVGFCRNSNLETAYPVKGDKYDREVGIAVCYAKCRGQAIPDYI